MNGGERHVLGWFGTIPSRGSMARFVYYTEESLCLDDVDMNKTFPFRGQQQGHPFFLLTKYYGELADCSPVRMARVAQAHGASGLILGEAHCRCQDANCLLTYKEDTDSKHCWNVDPPLVDDGSARDVTIPTAMLLKTISEDLYKSLKDENQPVLMELTWGLPVSDGDIPSDYPADADVSKLLEPEYRLWSSAYDPLLNVLAYKDLRTLAVAFGSSIHFSPRFFLQDGTLFGCDVNNDKNPCADLCTHHGHYCSSHGAHSSITGRAIVQETLRRLCIYQHYPAFPNDIETDGGSSIDHKEASKKSLQPNTAYWDYVVYHMEHCAYPDHLYSDEKCIEESYKAAKIDNTVIDSCMKETGNETQTSNRLLDEMLTYQRYSSVVEIPAITINHRYKTEQPSARSLFTELCAHFWEATMESPFDNHNRLHVTIPSVCETCGACSNVVGCMRAGQCVPWSYNHDHDQDYHPSKKAASSSSGGRGWTIFFVFLFALAVGGAYWYYKRREQMGELGRGLLDGYMRLSGGSRS